jgi:hypothetical protein
MNSVGSHGSLSLLFMMKVMVCHFVSDSHEVMTVLIVVLPLIVAVEICLQLHQSIFANLNILSRPSLIELFSRGTKFRSGFLSMLSIEEAIDKGLKKFVHKQEELLGVQGILSEWKAKVLLFVQKRTRASFVVRTSSDSSLSVPLGDMDHLKILQRSFVITCMDKCWNNFVFVCKKFYVSSVFSDLNSPVGAYVVSNLAQSNILKFHLSFNNARNFKGVKCGPRLSFLCAVWKFHRNPIKPRFICATSSTSLTDVSKWLCFFFKAMFPTVNHLWVSKLKKADVPCDSSWILNGSTGVVEVINNLNRLRSEIDKASPLLLQFFDFSTLYTKIDLVDLKACMRVLINKVFNRMLKLDCFKFFMVQKTALNFRFLWLKITQRSLCLKIFIASKLQRLRILSLGWISY